jgi:F0F1-type ATP synthase assembly protein I
MERSPKDSRSDYRRQLRLAGMALVIPTLLAASPLVGFYLGRWIGALLGGPQIGGLIGLALGFVAGVRETIRLIRRVQAGMK